MSAVHPRAFHIVQYLLTHREVMHHSTNVKVQVGGDAGFSLCGG